MLINKDQIPVTQHVKFVRYSGKFPNLCGGILTLEIDGKNVSFGSEYKDKTVDYPRFWSVRDTDITCRAEWCIDVNELPIEFREYAAEIDEVFNANVERGHCGGCR